MHPDLVILDELGYLPFSQAAVRSCSEDGSHQDEKGRLWDVVIMAVNAARRAARQSTSDRLVSRCGWFLRAARMR